MPRPHALPRRPSTQAGSAFPAFVPPPPRPLATVNVHRASKAEFDALQAWFSFHEGRSLHQCEAFALLLDVALRSGDPRLAGYADVRARQDDH